MLKADYDEQYSLAAGETGEVSERFVPRVGEAMMKILKVCSRIL